jgi:hypothetical protein
MGDHPCGVEALRDDLARFKSLFGSDAENDFLGS